MAVYPTFLALEILMIIKGGSEVSETVQFEHREERFVFDPPGHVYSRLYREDSWGNVGSGQKSHRNTPTLVANISDLFLNLCLGYGYYWMRTTEFGLPCRVDATSRGLESTLLPDRDS
jgi:hypothetical protein